MFLFQQFNTADVCDPINIWRFNAIKNTDTLEISLMQAGSASVEFHSLTIINLKTNGLFWFLDSIFQVATLLVYLYGGKYYQLTHLIKLLVDLL